jgi:outer membrane protein OmpA-like peptidoglycan-associated protein
MYQDYDIVSGDFEGTFYTNQKSVLTATEWNANEKDHAVHLYRGELKTVTREETYEPELFRNRESMLLHNVTNVQFQLSSSDGTNTSRIYDFEQLLIRDAVIKDSWELNGKTYGIVCGKVLGKVRKVGSHFDPTNPPPSFGSDIPQIIPYDGGNRLPPVTPPVNRIGGGCFSRLLSILWRLLLAAALFLVVLWLLRSCFAGGDTSQVEYCCKERDSLRVELDSTQKINRELNDSIQNRLIQEELDRLSSEVYFLGDQVEIRGYSKSKIKAIVQLLNKNPNVVVEIRGYFNGVGKGLKIPEYNNASLDLARAMRVKDLLINYGASEDRLSAIGKGRSMDYPDLTIPIIRGGEVFQWNRNMRVEIKIVNQ